MDHQLVSSESPQIEKYLEDKYKEEFVIKNVEIENSPFFCGYPKQSIRSIKADIYPANNKEVKFEVVKCLNTDPSYEDNYPNKLWSYQERDAVRTFLATVFKTVPDFEVIISAIPPFDLGTNIKGNPVDFKTFIEYAIRVRIDDASFNDNISLHKANAYKILEHLRQSGNSKTRIMYDVDIKSQDTSYSCYYGDTKDYEYNAKSPDDLYFQELGMGLDD